MVGTFDCTGSMVDIAVDRAGKMTGTAAISFNNALGGALVTVDPATAHCTVLNRGENFITSLTYVPEGTLLPSAEALVGYAEDRYVRVDPATGSLTDIGLLNNAASGGIKWISSGDVVSIKDGGTYLTVKPETGAMPGAIGSSRSIPRPGRWCGSSVRRESMTCSGSATGAGLRTDSRWGASSCRSIS